MHVYTLVAKKQDVLTYIIIISTYLPSLATSDLMEVKSKLEEIFFTVRP